MCTKLHIQIYTEPVTAYREVIRYFFLNCNISNKCIDEIYKQMFLTMLNVSSKYYYVYFSKVFMKIQ